jgi:hypothetical protein
MTRNRHIDLWDRIEDLEISPHSYSHLVFEKIAALKTYIEKPASSTNGVGKIDIHI